MLVKMMMRRNATGLLALLMAAVLIGCEDERADQPVNTPVSQQPRPALPATTAEAELPRVVFLGDSLTAGHGIAADDAFPAVVGRMLREAGRPIQVVNAGVSGDTTAGGVRRLDWILRQKPDVVVVGLGGNDGLRGTDLATSEENLRSIIRRCQEAGARVLLLGMMIPPNYGPEYTQQFRDVYPRLAAELNVPLVPFLLEGVGGVASLNLQDGIHPTEAGHEIVARNVLPHLQALVDEVPSGQQVK